MPNREKHPTDEQQKAKALSRWENEGGAKAKSTRRPRSLNAAPRSATGEVDRHQRSIGSAVPMNDNPTAIERAFQLANTGRYASVVHIQRALTAEGYSKDQVEGPVAA